MWLEVEPLATGVKRALKKFSQFKKNKTLVLFFLGDVALNTIHKTLAKLTQKSSRFVLQHNRQLKNFIYGSYDISGKTWKINNKENQKVI